MNDINKLSNISGINAKHEIQIDYESHKNKRALPGVNWILIGFLLIIGYFLLMEHRAHIVEFLPWFLLAACLLMHFFMHGKHSGERRD